MTVARYFAELDESNVVLRVIVCDDPQWIADRLGGTWVETADPYVDPGEVAYCGVGWGHDETWPLKFAPQWVQPVAPDEDGNWPYNVGSVAFDAGRLWVSTVDANVQPPGVANWRNIPTTPGRPPVWVQPSGSEDTFQTGEHVLYPDEQGDEYESLIDNNTTTPGSDDRWWRKVGDEPSGPEPWTQRAYSTGEQVTWEGRVYESVIDNNVWSPSGYPDGWNDIGPA